MAILKKLLCGQRPLLQPLRQRLSFQVLHHQKIKSLRLPNVMERADMRMIQVRDGPGFPFKAFPQVRPQRQSAGKEP